MRERERERANLERLYSHGQVQEMILPQIQTFQFAKPIGERLSHSCFAAKPLLQPH